MLGPIQITRNSQREGQLSNNSSAVAEMGNRGHNRHGRKEGGGAAVPLLRGRSWVPVLHNVTWAAVYLPTNWHLDPSSRLATTDMGRKLGGAVPFLWGELDPHLTQSSLGQGLRPHQVAS